MTDSSTGAEDVEYRGRVIRLRRLTPEGGQRQPLLLGILSATSPWGVQEELWEWSVLDDSRQLACGSELSRTAALEEARHWIDLETPDDPNHPPRGS